MKILSIRFKNLNSLAGEWYIDFTHPDFSSNGIFAITGPTGAGKTTVLDALCLGLYGRTPRLDKITKSSNEIMSRQAGECFAEVEFETLKGRYRCHWSQHRARKKPDGELQQTKHEICEADSGKVLESRIALVGEFIEKVTGMDFERCTRSMLLAQGGFAVFLKAPPNERAPILEQITGTEIYSRISMKVHEKRSDENNKLEMLQAELKGIQILSEDDEKNLSNGLEEKQKQETELSGKIKEIAKALNRIEGIIALEKDLEELDKKQQDLGKRRQAFEPESKKLEKSRKALGLEVDYRSITALRDLQDNETKKLHAAAAILPEKESVCTSALVVRKTAETALNGAREKQQSEADIIKKVRDLDTRLGEQKKQLIEKNKEVKEVEKQLSEFKRGIDNSERELKKLLKDLEIICEYRTKHAADSELMTNLSAIEKVFALYQAVNNKHLKALKEVDEADKKKEDAASDCKKLEAEHKKLLQEYEKKQKEYKNLTDEISLILKGRDISQLRAEIESFKDRERLLIETDQTITRIDKTYKTIDESAKRVDELKSNNSKISDEIKTNSEKRDLLEKTIDIMETQVSLLCRIHDLEEERKRLEDGKPCPLCGATDHPYAQGNVPALNEAESGLKRTKTEFKKLSDKLGKLENERVKTAADIEYAEKNIKEYKTTLADGEKLCKEEMSALNIEAVSYERSVKVRKQLSDVKAKIDGISLAIKTVEEKTKKEKTTQTGLEKTREKLLKADKTLQDYTHKMNTAASDYERQKIDCDALAKEADKVCEDAASDVKPFGISQISSDTIDELLTDLTKRRNIWQSKELEINSLGKKIDELKAGIEKNKAVTDKLEADLSNRSTERGKLMDEHKALSLSRFDMFGEKNADDEEKLLAEAVDKADKTLEKERERYVQIEKEISALKDKAALLKEKTEIRATELALTEEKFSLRIKTAGFEDEADYLLSRLGEEEQDLLAKKEQALHEEKLELDARWRDRSETLAAESGKNLTDQSVESLTETIRTDEADLKQLRFDIGGIVNRLTDNEKRRKNQDERIKSIENQKKECARWDNLHQLIGSADGKKFRNFAQGLTFEMMTAHANRQLKKMTDRYLLIRDKLQPLELNVIDNYQAGEVRSTKNLSGGESFIVSLALALGLSQMASRNVRVDSLFLDEGFGTLDEDALETAIETLAELQQDGKLIGVISHVSVLKERIGTQIEVIPEAGGRSRLVGPGCSRI